MSKPWPERLPQWMRDGAALAVGATLFFGGPAWAWSALTFSHWRVWLVAGVVAQLAAIAVIARLVVARGCPRPVAISVAVAAAALSGLPALYDLVEGPVHLRGWPVEPASASGSCVEDEAGSLVCLEGPVAECGERARELALLAHLDLVLVHRCAEDDERRLHGGWSEMWREGVAALAIARAMDAESQAKWAAATVESDPRTLFGILDALEARDQFYLPALERVLARSDWLAVIAANRLWDHFPEQAVAISERVLAEDVGAATTTLRNELAEHRANHR